MKLYTTSPIGNMQADFIMIVAKIANVQVEEVVVAEAGSEQDKELMKKAPLASYPILEVDGQYICDSIAIATLIARKSKNGLLGSNAVEEAQVEQWLNYLRTETYPIV